MPSLSLIKSKAAILARDANNAEVQALAKLVAELAAACQDVEKKAAAAEDEARRAKRAAKR